MLLKHNLLFVVCFFALVSKIWVRNRIINVTHFMTIKWCTNHFYTPYSLFYNTPFSTDLLDPCHFEHSCTRQMVSCIGYFRNTWLSWLECFEIQNLSHRFDAILVTYSPMDWEPINHNCFLTKLLASIHAWASDIIALSNLKLSVRQLDA